MKKSNKRKKAITGLAVAAFRKIKRNPAIMLWSLAVFFLLMFLVYIPHIASFLALVTAVLIAPVQKWQNFLNQKIKKVGKNIIIVVLAFVTLFAAPSETSTDQVTLKDDYVYSTTKTTGASSEILTQPTETKVPTQVATEPPVTEAPAQKPIEPPVTEAPVQKPTEPPVTEAPVQKPTKPAVTETPTQKPTEPPVTEVPTEPTTKVESERDYVLNTSTKKFHYPSCSDVKRIKDENREEFHGARDELIDDGYKPCGHCEP